MLSKIHVRGSFRLVEQTCRKSTAAIFNEIDAVKKDAFVIDPDLAYAKPFDDVPGTKGLLGVLKVMLEFLPFGKHRESKPLSLSEIHMSAFERFGAISRMDFPGTKHGYVLLFDPDDIRKVFRHEGRYPYRNLLPTLTTYRKSRRDLYPNLGLLADNGEDWLKVRTKAQVPLMKPQIVQSYIPKMSAVAAEFVDRIHSLRNDANEIPDLMDELFRWTIECLGLVSFNTSIGCLKEESYSDSEPHQLLHGVHASLDLFLKMEVRSPFQLFGSKKKLFDKLIVHQEYIMSVAEKYSKASLDKIRRSQDLEEDDFGAVGEILKRSDFDPRYLNVVILDMFTAGVETTSHAAAFLMYLLASNMKEQERIHEELDRILPSPEIPITPQFLQQLRWLNASIKESLRLMATVDGTYRVLDHDISLSGYRVPAGSILCLLTQVASLLSNNFHDADKFLPERWISSPKPHPCANLPFSFGVRSCIGRRFAVQMLQLFSIKSPYKGMNLPLIKVPPILSRPVLLLSWREIFQKYRVEYHHGDMKRISRLVNAPDRPLLFSFVERK